MSANWLKFLLECSRDLKAQYWLLQWFKRTSECIKLEKLINICVSWWRRLLQFKEDLDFTFSKNRPKIELKNSQMKVFSSGRRWWMNLKKNGLPLSLEEELRFISTQCRLKNWKEFLWKNSCREKMLNWAEYLVLRTLMLKLYMSLLSRWPVMSLDTIWKF